MGKPLACPSIDVDGNRNVPTMAYRSLKVMATELTRTEQHLTRELSHLLVELDIALFPGQREKLLTREVDEYATREVAEFIVNGGHFVYSLHGDWGSSKVVIDLSTNLLSHERATSILLSHETVESSGLVKRYDTDRVVNALLSSLDELADRIRRNME